TDGLTVAAIVQNYLEGRPLWTRWLVSIPDHAQLVRELRLLERRTARSGRDSVDHGAHGSDDYANALSGALRLAGGKRQGLQIPAAAMQRARMPRRFGGVQLQFAAPGPHGLPQPVPAGPPPAPVQGGGQRVSYAKALSRMQ